MLGNCQFQANMIIESSGEKLTVNKCCCLCIYAINDSVDVIVLYIYIYIYIYKDQIFLLNYILQRMIILYLYFCPQ